MMNTERSSSSHGGELSKTIFHMNSEWEYLELSDEKTHGRTFKEVGLRCESRGRQISFSSKRKFLCENYDENISIYLCKKEVILCMRGLTAPNFDVRIW